MTAKPSQNAINVQAPEGLSIRVEFMGAGGQLFINGQSYAVNETGLAVPVNDQQKSNLAQRGPWVGQRLRDGTVLMSFDLDKKEALLVPEKIFGGVAKFDDQDDVIKSVNGEGLHGHIDWRRITDNEGQSLESNWTKVTTQDPVWFWLASPHRGDGGCVRKSGELIWSFSDRNNSKPVPVVRSVPVRNLDI